jgi:hypothetical protein
VSWEAAWAGAAVARQFVRRLARVDKAELQQAVSPVLDRDPYLSAWTNIQAALGTAPAADRERIQELLVELDGQIETLSLVPSLQEAAKRAVRALLVRRWLLAPESLTFAYEPFESVVPLTSLAPAP